MAQQLEANHKEATPSRDNSTLTIFYTEELDDQVMVRLNLSDFFVYLCLLQLATCTFRRGDRYWSGSPQPIGIDFSAHEAFVFHAHGSFTGLTFHIQNSSPRWSRFRKFHNTSSNQCQRVPLREVHQIALWHQRNLRWASFNSHYKGRRGAIIACALLVS